MAELTFKQVCAFIKKENTPELIEKVDKLLGCILLCSFVHLGPMATTLFGLLGVKNELVSIGKDLFRKITGKDNTDYLDRQQRMEMAYCLICYTAFFEALDQVLEDLAKRIQLPAEFTADVFSATPKFELENPEDGFASYALSLPHPAEFFDKANNQLDGLYEKLTEGFLDALQALDGWKSIENKKGAEVVNAFRWLPHHALERFYAQYSELAIQYEEFYVWSNLYEHNKTRYHIDSLADLAKQAYKILAQDKGNIDIGFKALQRQISDLPEQVTGRQADRTLKELFAHYNSCIDFPLIKDQDIGEEGEARLIFPKIAEAFIPQSFRAIRYLKETNLENEEVWAGRGSKNDVGTFLRSYFSSPYSVETPLLILGHPGSGKSLLTQVLSARLVSSPYIPIYVALRDINAEADIQNQIEQQILKTTGREIKWANLSDYFQGRQPVIFLDGYDELLQVSGKVFANYLMQVWNFQQREKVAGRPLCMVVTSRITLIDKTEVPKGSTILRLEEFDQDKRCKWIDIWNTANKNYFTQLKLKPFSLPDDPKIIPLAEQPLLLLMLALYDSDGNKLANSRELDKTVLYDSLLRRFIEREETKKSEFNGKIKDRETIIHDDMRRLGVAAIGMYNRRSLYILSSQLNQDLKFFQLEKKTDNGNDQRALSQAELLLGSFFFVHQSRSLQRGEKAGQLAQTTAFEFLHNTFGEFLTADFILKIIMDETGTINLLKHTELLQGELAQKIHGVDGLSTKWFATLMYSPLYSRPVVLEMMREWLPHVLEKTGRHKEEFFENFDLILVSQIKRMLQGKQLPSIMSVEDNHHSKSFPLLGHVAIYTLNLIILRTVLSQDHYILDEKVFAGKEEGTRPWEQLIYIWRYWFSLDNLNGLTAILVGERRGSQIILTPKKNFGGSSMARDGLHSIFKVSTALGDTITAGMSGLLLYTMTENAQLDLGMIQKHLYEEKIDLAMEIKFYRLKSNQRQQRHKMEFTKELIDVFIKSLENKQFHIVNEILFLFKIELVRGIKLLGKTVFECFTWQFISEVFEKQPTIAIHLISLLWQTGHVTTLAGFPQEFFTYCSMQKISELMENEADVALDLICLVQTMHNERLTEQLEKVFLNRLSLAEMINLLENRTETVMKLFRFIKEKGNVRNIENFSRKIFEQLTTERMGGLITTSPEITIKLLILVRNIGNVKITEHYNQKILSYLSPGLLMDLMESRPDLVVELFSLLRDDSNGKTMEIFSKDFFEQIPPGRMKELIEIRPDIAIYLLRLLRENGNIKAKEGFSRKFFIQLASHPMEKLMERRPDVACDLFRLMRETGRVRSMNLFNQEFIKYLSLKRIRELVKKKPALAIELLRVMRDSNNVRLEKKMEEELFSYFTPRQVCNLMETKPNIASEWFCFMRETQEKKWLQQFASVLGEDS